MTNVREQAGHERLGETVDEAGSAFRDMTDTLGRKVLTPAERAASKALKKEEGEKGMTEYRKAQDAFNANRERLKAERLACEPRKLSAEPDKPAVNQDGKSLANEYDGLRALFGMQK